MMYVCGGRETDPVRCTVDYVFDVSGVEVCAFHVMRYFCDRLDFPFEELTVRRTEAGNAEN